MESYRHHLPSMCVSLSLSHFEMQPSFGICPTLTNLTKSRNTSQYKMLSEHMSKQSFDRRLLESAIYLRQEMLAQKKLPSSSGKISPSKLIESQKWRMDLFRIHTDSTDAPLRPHSILCIRLWRRLLWISETSSSSCRRPWEDRGHLFRMWVGIYI